MLQALGFQIRKHHMNEGHSAFLALELLNRYKYQKHDLRPGESPYDAPFVRSKCIFTTHTPVEAGQDQFDYAMVERIADSEFLDLNEVRKWAGEDRLNMTRLALNLSDYINGSPNATPKCRRRCFLVTSCMRLPTVCMRIPGPASFSLNL